MKKVLLCLVIILALTAATCFAAPFNTLKPGQTAIGLTYWGSEDDKNKTVTDEDFTLGGGYLEHRFDKIAIGFETMGRSDTYIEWPVVFEEDTTATDLYLHYYLNDNVRLLLGKHSYEIEFGGTSSNKYSDDKVYVGAAYSAPLADSVEGYVALTTASIQLGANINFSDSFAANLFYRTFDWDDKGFDGTLSGLGVSLALKF